MITNDLIRFGLAFIILAYSSRFLIRSLSNIARFMNVSDYAISFILMGFATSVPELFVAISSGVGGTANLSFGNIIGANILNVTLLIGVIALIAGGLPNRDLKVKADAWIVLTLAVLPLLLVLDGKLDRPDGLVLIVVYFWYLNRLWHKQKILGRTLNHFGKKLRGITWVLKEVGLFVLGVILLLAASAFVVAEAEKLTGNLNLDLGIFGILIVALGTTVPELTFGLRSVLHKHEQMTLGTAIGSVAVNSTFILGLLALISPFTVVFSPAFKLSIAVLVISLWLFNIFLTNDRPIITKKEGLVLLIVYLVFATVSWLIIG